jgi:hypothetical protein
VLEHVLQEMMYVEYECMRKAEFRKSGTGEVSSISNDVLRDARAWFICLTFYHRQIFRSSPLLQRVRIKLTGTSG